MLLAFNKATIAMKNCHFKQMIGGNNGFFQNNYIYAD